MKTLILALALLTSFAISCKKSSTDHLTPISNLIPEGNYEGTFQRQNANNTGSIANVTLTFTNNSWIGLGQYQKYPALCNGTYFQKTTDSVSFNNLCFWTADFDWTLILSGDYKIFLSGNYLELSRNYGGVFTDIYKLNKRQN